MEFALVLPLLIALVVGGIEVASLSISRQAVTGSVRSASLAAAQSDPGPRADVAMIGDLARRMPARTAVSRVVLYDPEAPEEVIEGCLAGTPQPGVCTVLRGFDLRAARLTAPTSLPTDTCDGTPVASFCSLDVAGRELPELGVGVVVRIRSRLAGPFWPLRSFHTERIVVPIASTT